MGGTSPGPVVTSAGLSLGPSLFLLRGKSGWALTGRDHGRVGALGLHSGLWPLMCCVTWDESGNLSEPPFTRPGWESCKGQAVHFTYGS